MSRYAYALHHNAKNALYTPGDDMSDQYTAMMIMLEALVPQVQCQVLPSAGYGIEKLSGTLPAGNDFFQFIS
jgi:hypothetical protein